MAEIKRTATEIWAYIKVATEGPWLTGLEGIYWPITRYDPEMLGVCKYEDLLCSENAGNDAIFMVNAREDLPRVLEDAQKLRRALKEAWGEPCDAEERALWANTAYLAEEDTDGD